uniref:Uncharacterized protein n=1 Tax=Romanomermis culicivorax TaxID=13658 RepID=A0A915HG19_ROMCU
MRLPLIKRQSGHRVIRRECRTLSPDQFRAWHRAVRGLKETYIDSRSKYDLIVFYHLPQTAPAAHFGPSFLPYHRELLK